MKVLKGLPPPRRGNKTNLFLHAGAGEDTTLLLQAGGDQFGHGSRVGGVLHLWGHKTREAYSIHTPKKINLKKKKPTTCLFKQRNVSCLGGNTFDIFYHKSSQSGEVFLREVHRMQQRNEARADSGNERRDLVSKQVKTQVWIRTRVAKVAETDSWSTRFRNKIVHEQNSHYGIHIFYLNSELKIYLYILRMKEKSLQCDIAIVLRYIYSNTQSVYIISILLLCLMFVTSFNIKSKRSFLRTRTIKLTVVSVH